MSVVSLVKRVLLHDLRFERPHELRSAVHRGMDDITSTASRYGIHLEEGQAFDAVRAAMAAGYLRAAEVVLPDNDRRLEVIDQSDFITSLDRFFADVSAGSLPNVTTQPSARPTRPEGRQRDGLRRCAWTPVGRWVCERVLRTPARLWLYVRWGPFTPAQHPSEIVGLLELMRRSRPNTVLEIGTATGGTTYLLSHFTAPKGTVITVDRRPGISSDTLRRGSRRRQSIEVVILDSHTAEARNSLHERLRDGVDVLFVDGDHTYEGVRQDFVEYADLLRPGSLLVFHDVVDDYSNKYGIKTNAWVGGVPQFWRELTQAAPATFEIREYIDDPGQDGLGIGVIVCPTTPNPGEVLREAYL